ncbi:hypothetical protein H5410_026642 [Solanum commersonii]|uniref:Uncharacterized protein n=1 Tax=Solanum commersonii TaxID=4109 RepID=A0A9J5Z234_SOLCO|nr:hypothetical protein H5410_026642 [Solanum commersonii]
MKSASGNKNKNSDNAPKKKKKKDGMISRQPTGIHIRSDFTNSLPSRDTPIYCYSKQTEPYSRVPPHINPPSTYMHPPLEYTQPPPPMYLCPHQEANRPTSSDSRTVTHNPIDSQPSSSPTSQLGIQGNGSEPNTPTTNQSATPSWVLTQVGVRDMHNRLVIEPDGYTFNPDDAVGIISQAIKDLYRCFSDLGKDAKQSQEIIFFGNKNPRWILPEDWKKLLVHWANDPRFKQMSEIGKKARSSTKGGSLHTTLEDLRQTQPEENRGMPLSQEQVERLWLDLIGGQSLKAQLDALLASGGIPPCSNDVTFPPRPSQPQPTRYSVYGQQRNMTDESSSDEEDEDHVANTLLH